MSHPESRSPAAGYALAVTAAIAFALSSASASLAFQGGSNPLTLAAARFILPAVALVTWLIIQGRSVRLPERDGWIAAGLGALTAAYSWALLSAIGAIPLALAVLIFYLFPLVTAVILSVLGWEKINSRTIAAIVVAFIGLVLALDPRAGTLNIQGVALAFAASLGFGTVLAVSGRLLRSADARPVTLYMATVSSVLLIASCAQQGAFALPTTTAGRIAFAAAALLYALAMIVFFIAVSLIGPSSSSLLCYAEPVVAAVLGVIMLGEFLTLKQFGGIVLIVGVLVGASLFKLSETACPAPK